MTMLSSRKPTIMHSLYMPLLLKQTNKQTKQRTTTTKACQKDAGSKTNGATNLTTSNRCAKYLLMKGCSLNASERLVCVLLPFNRINWTKQLRWIYLFKWIVCSNLFTNQKIKYSDCLFRSFKETYFFKYINRHEHKWANLVALKNSAHQWRNGMR